MLFLGDLIGGKMRKDKDFGLLLFEGSIDLAEPIRKQMFLTGMKGNIERAYEVLNASTVEEIDSIVSSLGNNLIDMESYKKVSDDIDELKDRLIVHYCSYLIHLNFVGNLQVRGPKGDKIKKFFDAITNDPQDSFDLSDEYGLEYSIVKNHRRFDPYPERGITKIKNGKIFRQPID